MQPCRIYCTLIYFHRSILHKGEGKSIWNYIIGTFSKGLMPKQLHFSHPGIRLALFANSLTMIWYYANLIDWKKYGRKTTGILEENRFYSLTHYSILWSINRLLFFFFYMNSVYVILFPLFFSLKKDICKLVHWSFLVSVFPFYYCSQFSLQESSSHVTLLSSAVRMQ